MLFRLPFLSLLLLLSCQNTSQDNGKRLESFDNDTSRENSEPFRQNDNAGSDMDDPDRQEWQNPALVIEKLGDLQGKTVADIGAGTGYFSFRLAERGAQVIAIDIDEQYLDYIDTRQEESMVSPEDYHITTRLTQPDDPMLAPGEADAVLIVNTYTYLNDRVDYLRRLFRGMDEDGTIVIVDYRDAANPVMNDSVDIIDPDKVAGELEQAGFSDVEIDRNSLQYQYIITANK